ncbi:MAG: ATP-dependent zinc metalloprotease FtsH [Nitrospinota bacterium]
MNNIYKNIATWLIIGIVLVGLFSLFNQVALESPEISFSEFIELVEDGKVKSVVIQSKFAKGELVDQKLFKVHLVDYPDLFELLKTNGVMVSSSPEDKTSWLLSMFVTALPLIVIIGLWIFFMRQMQNGGSRAMSFGKSKARLVPDSQNKVTFSDVAGVEEAQEDLQEIVEFLKDPSKFQKLGGRIPKGVLLVGSPGTGKTLLARAIAGEANVPFFSISGSDFVEMFVGVGASRVRDLFEQAKKSSPCIVFVDEIDAVGRHRGAGLGGGHDEREQTLNQLLVEMDGFEATTSIIIIAATNRPDVLDPALLRPGRFDRQIVVPSPDIAGRTAILKVHVKNIPLDADVDIKSIARGTPGFTGADLANLCNEAALMAAKEDANEVSMKHFENAKDKVMMGAERRSMVISPKEKEATAIHEAGHALVALLLDNTDPIHKVSIIPRGRALGVTQYLPIDEKHTHPKEYLINRLAIVMGGRAAEELVLNNFSTGAANDIVQATDTSRLMVCEWGMSEKIGPVAFGSKNEQIFLGREIQQHRDFSENTAIEIDNEIRSFVTQGYSTAISLLKEHQDILMKISDTLIDIEVMEGREVVAIVREMLNAKNLPIPNNAAFTMEQESEVTAEKATASSGDKVDNKDVGGGDSFPADPVPIAP